MSFHELQPNVGHDNGALQDTPTNTAIRYPPPANGVPSLLIDNDEDHSKNRRLLSHAFSDKALQEQEPLIQKYVDQLVDRLKEVTSKDSRPVDMTKWYNWITFDIVADLLFGEPFGCLQVRSRLFRSMSQISQPLTSITLQNLSTHKHIDLLFRGVKGFRLRK